MDGTSLIHEALREQLKNEVRLLVDELNHYDETGNQQDGFSIANLDDGWVSYKGMSWGFAFHREPLCIDMTFGPDQPFVGHRKILFAEPDKYSENGLMWVDRFGEGRKWKSLKEVAQYGLQCLAAKVHESLPSQFKTFFYGESGIYYSEHRP